MLKSSIKSLIILGAIMAMSACSGSPSLNPTSFNNSHVPLSNASKLLRSPEGLDHSYTYEEYSDPEYKEFKNKLSIFSHKIADAYVKSSFAEDKNITISPFSIEMCLGLAIRSTNNNTRKEILDAMGVDYATFNKYYKLLFNEMQFTRYGDNNDIMSQLLITNSIWIGDEIELKDDALDALRDDYYCYSYQSDFNDKNKKSCEDIQKFIYEKTKGLLNPTIELDIRTLFVLMNTLYLKDVWNEAAHDLAYTNMDVHFTNYDQSVSTKPLLEGGYREGKIIETDNYSSFYTTTNTAFSIHFVKPKGGKRIQEVFNEETMSYVTDRKNYVTQDDEKLERYHTKCIFPEYTADGDIELKNMLSNTFGIKTLFEETKCDFSSITDKDAFVMSVRHIAKLKVDKKGIEGAAVTLMVAGATGMPDQTYTDVYDTFVADKEFGFILTSGDTVLFSGIVTNIDK